MSNFLFTFFFLVLNVCELPQCSLLQLLKKAASQNVLLDFEE